MNIASQILRLISGIGIFLIACEIMSKNLEAISSDKLKKIFASISDNKIVGVLIGALATVAIQSSSATTVMTIGFVNAGIMSLKQAATIIFGGEIGTTITGQIVALGMIKGDFIDPDILFSALAGIGTFINMFAKKEKVKTFGNILAGLGMLFVGLSIMSSSMESFAKIDGFKNLLMSANNVILLVIIGAIATAVIQSSSAITSIAITMIYAGLINLEQGIYITLGANIGTCLTGLLAGLKTDGVNAKRASYIQVIFNVSGVVILMLLDYLIKFLSNNSFSVSIFIQKLFNSLPQVQLAMFHTIFNVASVLVVLPLTDAFVKMIVRLVPDEQESIPGNHFYFIDENMLKTPSIAVSQVKKEIIHMGSIAIENFNIAMDIIKNNNYAEYDTFRSNEKHLNFLNQNLVDIIIKLSKMTNISTNDHRYLSKTYKNITDFERIGDYSENIIEYAENLHENSESFTGETLEEVNKLQDLINKLYEVTMHVYEKDDRKQFRKAMKIEEDIDKQYQKMTKRHINRLNNGDYTANVGAQYLKLGSDIERIGDHLININDKDYEASH